MSAGSLHGFKSGLSGHHLAAWKRGGEFGSPFQSKSGLCRSDSKLPPNEFPLLFLSPSTRPSLPLVLINKQSKTKDLAVSSGLLANYSALLSLILV